MKDTKDKIIKDLAENIYDIKNTGSMCRLKSCGGCELIRIRKRARKLIKNGRKNVR